MRTTLGRDMHAIEDKLNEIFNSLCIWFVEDKLSIHFGDNKTKSFIFGSKRRLKEPQVKYLECIFDCNTSGEAMSVKVLNKVNSRLRVSL